MAQRTIHYLFGEIFSGQIKFKDKNRFLLGSVLPDAYADGCERDVTHFACTDPTGNYVYFNFEKYREKYFELIQKDDLYLGYYMHLVEDDFYRQFIYNNQFKMPRNKKEVTILHNDYHVLNSYIVKKYNIQNKLEEPDDLKREPISEIATFRIDGFLKDMAYDFIEKMTGETRFLTENMLDEFIDKYAALGIKELQNIQLGRCFLRATDYAWSRNR